MNNKSTFLNYEVMKEEISPDNVFAMVEIIAFAETRYLIGYMGTQMQKTYIDLYKDILNKNDVSRVLSDGYDLVQECALCLCEHYGQHLSDVIHVLCEALNVSRGTFYNHILRNKKENAQHLLRHQDLSEIIKNTYEEYNGIYGATKIYYILKANGYVTSLKTVKRLMSEMGLKSVRSNTKKLFLKEQRTKRKTNHLQHDFSATEPNTRWVGDITECYVLDKKFYICAILDLFSRKIIAYKISNKASTQLTTATLKDAFTNRGNPNNLIFHSDQGCQYVSYAYQKLLHDLHITQSFSKLASPHDNSVMESFFSSFKKEETYRIHYRSVKEFKESVHRYIEFYNSERLHGANAYKSPNERERIYFESKKRGS